MIKVLQNNNIFNSTTANAKCGEIYCHSPTDFTILCAFCELKSFGYEDFLLHFKNIHFENNLLKTEQIDIEYTPYLSANIKNELNRGEDDYNSDDAFVLEEAPISPGLYEAEDEDQRLMKWQIKEIKEIPTGNNALSSSECEDDIGDEEYKPPREVKSEKVEKEFKCENCDKVYRTAGNLGAHIKREHKPPDAADLVPVNCKECDKEFSNQSRLDTHSIKEHNGIECLYCGKRFKCKTNFTRHVEIHVNPEEKNYACDFEGCTKRFHTKRAMQSHRRNHTGSKNYVCDVCGYSCRVAETLKVHYRTHTGEKPYVCSICSKRFTSSSLLSEHKAMHATGRPHVCGVCGSTFARQKALYHHRFLHLSEKKFKCRICGNAYAQASGLAGHMRKHKEEGNFDFSVN